MSSLTTWLWGTSQLDDAVDKATSELLPAGAEDIALNLEICDQIRSKSVPAKDSMRALKRRLNHSNPNVQNLALGLTDICIKNGGDHFLSEVASREFMDNLVSILKIPTLNIEVKNSILRHIQNWGVAFEGKPHLSYVGQVYKNLKAEGFTFPPQDPVLANSAMVDTQTAPEWIDSDVCLRCRTPFSFTNRKHHCRNCGQVFDQQCSSKSMPLPHFGITQEVRVCDGCWGKMMKKQEKDKSSRVHRHSTSRHRSSRSLADAELQRAIQLSLEEVGNSGSHARPGYVPAQPTHYSEPPLIDRSTYPGAIEEEDDPDLKAAIEASLREANAPKPSAPVETPRSEGVPSAYGQQPYRPPRSSSLPKMPSYELEPLESDVILTFSQTVEQVHVQGGRDMSRYPAVGELYDKANGLRPKLVASLDDADRKEQVLSEMHDKLSQIVKLYDKALTEHVSHHTWRSPQPTPAPLPYQQQYRPVNGWSTSHHMLQSPAQQAQIAGSPIAETSHVGQPQGHAYPQQTAETSQSQPQWHPQQPEQQQQQQFAQPAQLPLTYAPPPPQQYSQQPPVQHSPVLHPQHLQHQQYVSKSPVHAQSAQVAAPTQPAAPAQPQHSLPTTVPQQTTASASPYQIPSAPPQSSPQIPVSQPSQYIPTPTKSHVPHHPSLTRHNTIAYAPTSVPPTTNSSHGFLSRHNTVTHAPSRQQQSHYQQPQHEQQQPVLPQFPAVPTSVPQDFNMYSTPAPQPVTERKEALLIDL